MIFTAAIQYLEKHTVENKFYVLTRCVEQLWCIHGGALCKFFFLCLSLKCRFSGI